MHWPPNKSWTSKKITFGYRHFVAINYGGIEENRWVVLVSVLDPRVRLRVNWSELNEISLWETGWIKLRKQELNLDSIQPIQGLIIEDGIGLEVSSDSGLIPGSESTNTRPW